MQCFRYRFLAAFLSSWVRGIPLLNCNFWGAGLDLYCLFEASLWVKWFDLYCLPESAFLGKGLDICDGVRRNQGFGFEIDLEIWANNLADRLLQRKCDFHTQVLHDVY